MKPADIKQTFGAKIKVLRKEAVLTQLDLAAAVDIDVRTIRRIESGAYNPTLIIIAKLATALKVSLPELFK